MTSFDPHKNFVYSTVGTAPSPASSGTTFSVQSGDGVLFPDPASVGAYNVVVCSAATATAAEVCRVTARATDLLTLARAQESSAARNISVGDAVFMGPTAKTFTDLEAAVQFPPGYVYAQISGTSNATTTISVQANAVTILNSGTLTFSGSTVVGVEFYAPQAYHSVASGVVVFDLWQDSTDTAIARGISPLTNQGPPVSLRKVLTPTAGAHTFTIRMWAASAGTVHSDADSGSAMFLRVEKSA